MFHFPFQRMNAQESSGLRSEPVSPGNWEASPAHTSCTDQICWALLPKLFFLCCYSCFSLVCKVYWVDQLYWQQSCVALLTAPPALQEALSWGGTAHAGPGWAAFTEPRCLTASLGTLWCHLPYPTPVSFTAKLLVRITYWYCWPWWVVMAILVSRFF